MTTIRLIPLLAGAAALVAMLGLAGPADALEKCKANIKGKDGTIEVQAKDVQGPLMWGNESGQETETFFNAGTCIDGDKAKKCVFGAEGTVARITPPAGCTVYLDDGVGPACSAYIKKCIPGARTDALAAVCEEIRGTETCDLGEVIDTVGNCTGYGGIVVGGACWFFAAQAGDCDTACVGPDLVYDDATRTYAGSDGTNAHCNAVLDALGAPASSIGNFPTSSCGCYVVVAGGNRNRATLATTSSCALATSQRACACK